ncbi:PAAR domain-containing protein [Scandinavium hiltneri]
MMNGVIRLNDPLEHGGYVNKASGSKFMGIAVALQGDTVICALHKGTFPIIEFDPTWRMYGKGVVIDDCKAACGCAIKTTLPTAGSRK